jgi:hypothetical protein
MDDLGHEPQHLFRPDRRARREVRQQRLILQHVIQHGHREPRCARGRADRLRREPGRVEEPSHAARILGEELENARRQLLCGKRGTSILVRHVT